MFKLSEEQKKELFALINLNCCIQDEYKLKRAIEENTYTEDKEEKIKWES